MGLMLIVFALGGFGFGAFWSAGISFSVMREKKWPLYAIIPISIFLGVIGGTLCGAAIGFGLGYIMLPHR